MEPKAHLAKCEDCPLAERPVVQGYGPENPEVVVCGEAPGYDEAKQGRPFVGRSGELLRKVLAYHEIDPEDVYYTNAVLCHPSGNETPKAKAVKACRDRLLDEVKRHRPKHVIAVGAVGAKALTGEKVGITALRKAGPQGHKDGYEVIPTFHTAAALRSPDKFPQIVSDVGKINRVEVVWEPTRYVVADPTTADALLRDQLGHSEMLAGDIELGKPFDRHKPNLLCFGVSHKPGHAVVYPAEVMPAVKALFNQGFRDRKWVWQNGKFDIQYLWSLGMTEAKVDEDTMLAHYATSEIKGTHALEQIATEVLNAPFWKHEAKTADKEEDSLEFLDPETLWRYNATDADITHRLVEPLHKEMRSDDVMEVYRELLIPGSAALAAMEYRGVRVDLEQLAEVERQVIADMERLEEPTQEWVENPRSPQQVLAALYELGFTVPNTTAEVLEGLADVHPFPRALLDYRKVQKIYSTYIKGLKKTITRGRVHPTFNLHGTETGRTSCRRPNMQNIPVDHPVRGCFTASDGHTFIEADYSQIEARVAATLTQDEWLREQFLEGRHIHEMNAVTLFGGDYTERQYILAKSGFFGPLYGEKASHLAHRFGITKREAENFIDSMMRRSPGIPRYRKEVIRQIQEQQYLTSVYGRKRRFWLITRDNAREVYKEGVNFTIQSAASDILLTALIKIHREKPYLNPVVNVHDSLIFDVPEESAEEAQREVIELMESVNPLDVPIQAEAERSRTWKLKT